jgi:tRNA (uracil-5-)-methyltransferase TRM9
MNAETVGKLLDINRLFYQTFGREFSATRRHIQPGVRRILERLEGTEHILDLGCGNGEPARALARRGHRGSYLGLDFSLPLLKEAKSGTVSFPITFLQADLASPEWPSDLQPASFDVIFAFAVLHHVPGTALRLQLLQNVHRLLIPGGRFIHSNWQFLESDRLKARILPWEMAGLSASEVDEGDYLLDWRAGGRGLRYVHHFAEAELSALAAEAGFGVIETFLSDGEGGRLGLYQIWETQ